MTYTQALGLMAAGKRVRRRYWAPRAGIGWLDGKREIMHMFTHTSRGLATSYRWRPRQADVQAQDWEEVPE